MPGRSVHTVRRIYLDYAATTPIHPEVRAAMMPYLNDVFGNASSVHSFGREARAALDAARDTIASLLGCQASELVFTSGGSEANNLAIFGAAFAPGRRQDAQPRVVTAAAEHHSVLNTALALRDLGCRVDVLPVDRYGMVSPDDLRRALREPACLVSVMAANNEVGTLQPIAELGAVAREHGALFHTDAVQAVGTIPLDLGSLPVDMLSFSAHKFHGPKGMGGLFVRTGVRLRPLVIGGGQERERRAGTENVAGAVGMAQALRLACDGMAQDEARVAGLRDGLISGLMERVEGVHLNGHPTLRLPGNVNVSFDKADGEALLLGLDLAGVACSSGSACTSGAIDPSHVLLAMGVPAQLAAAALRFSLGRPTTREEVEQAVEIIAQVVQRVRG